MNNNTMIQFFHWFYEEDKKLWTRVAEEAPNLHQMGITSVWLPPAYKTNSLDSVGYDAYDLFDLGEFDQKGSVPTKYGSKEEFIRAIETLHSSEIEVYADIVLNHKAGADETERVMVHKVNPDNREEIVSEDYEIEAYTKFTFPGRGHQYSDYIWDFHSFSGTDWDNRRKESGIFKILNEYGSDWPRLLYDEKGNFDYLMFCDIEFRNPFVVRELKKWGLWFLDTTQVDGFRLDALKHIYPNFYPEWLDHLRSVKKKPLFAVGEYKTSLKAMLDYLEFVGHRMSLFDFPLHLNFRSASKEKDYDLRKILDDTLTKSDPAHSVTFVDNHDSQAYRNRGLEVEDWFKPHAYALILLRGQGYPCVFYPDLYGFRTSIKIGEETRDVEVKKVASIEKLLLARKNYAYGAQSDYFVSEKMIGWTHSGIDEKPNSGMAVLLSGGGRGDVEMEVGRNHAGQIFYDLIHPRKEKVKIDGNGSAKFSVEGGEVAVWVPFAGN